MSSINAGNYLKLKILVLSILITGFIFSSACKNTVNEFDIRGTWEISWYPFELIENSGWPNYSATKILIFSGIKENGSLKNTDLEWFGDFTVTGPDVIFTLYRSAPSDWQLKFTGIFFTAGDRIRGEFAFQSDSLGQTSIGFWGATRK